MSVTSSEWGPPTSSPTSECGSPQDPNGGETHLLGVDGCYTCPLAVIELMMEKYFKNCPLHKFILFSFSRIFVKNEFGKTAWTPPPPEGVCTILLFGAEIQPKHLVFYYLGFLPGFSLVFCFLPHPMHSPFLENQAFLFWRIFSLGFLNPSNCLVFLEVLYAEQGPNRNIIFYLNIIKVEYSKEDIQTCQ